VRAFIRAAQAVALLVGFYVMGFVVLAGLVVLDVVLFRLGNNGQAALRITSVFTTVVLMAMVQGAVAAIRIRKSNGSGVAVAADAEPELWERVQRLARAVGTRAPDEIRIDSEVGAAVWEHGHLFGLLPGKRRMVIGAPLLLALTPAQLDAVLAHEFGHYCNSDTRLGPVVGRGRVSVLTALRAAERAAYGIPKHDGRRRFASPFAGGSPALFRGYAHIFFTLTEATSRQQEYAADLISARIAGSRNAAAALAELPAISAAYRFYLERYALSGLSLGLLPEPAQVIGGFGALLADPQRAQEIDAVRRNPPDEKPGRFDTHPPLSARIAALRALPDEEGAAETVTETESEKVTASKPGLGPGLSGERAVGILRDRHSILAAAGAAMLGDRAAGTRSVAWDGLIDAVAADQAERAAGPLQEAVRAVTALAAPTTRDLLDAVDAGGLEQILHRLPASDPAQPATGPAAREFAKTALARLLPDWVLAELAERERVSWTHSWSRFAELQAPAGLIPALEEAVDALVALKPDTAPLRTILEGRMAA
jgi:Zn-dependent protease with chaperone function